MIKKMTKVVPLVKDPINNDQGTFEWAIGGNDTNIILENKKLNVRLLRYIVKSSKAKPEEQYLYDALSIRESKNNSVVLIRNQDNEIGLVWEWRPIPERWFWACPRGFADPRDEDNLATAKRETIEEIGHCKIRNSQKVGSLYQNTTFFENPVGLVLLDVEEIKTQLSQDEGVMDFKFYSKEEILKMIRDDEIEDTFTLSAIMRLFALEA
ncbi:MAG: NUDIX hydrolase [Chloroflexota bacterium]